MPFLVYTLSLEILYVIAYHPEFAFTVWMLLLLLLRLAFKIAG